MQINKIAIAEPMVSFTASVLGLSFALIMQCSHQTSNTQPATTVLVLTAKLPQSQIPLGSSQTPVFVTLRLLREQEAIFVFLARAAALRVTS
jgi:hypothetical protein